MRYIIGRSGCGKTTQCISEAIEASKSSNVILIVPEQFTLETEKEVVKASGKATAMNIQILSFKRLAYSVFSETGMYDAKILTKTAKHMLLRKVVASVSKDLVYYKKAIDKPGFIKSLDTALTEFSSASRTSEEIMAAGSMSENLRSKLKDIIKIYECYNNYIKDKYISPDIELNFLAQKIKDSDICKGAQVWVDGFNGFTTQEYVVIRELLRYSQQVTFSINSTTANIASKPEEADPFYETKLTIYNINKIASAINITASETKLLIKEHTTTDSLDFLEKQFFNYLSPKYDGQNDSIKIYCASNHYDEIKYVAATIDNLVQNGMRYKDIAVVTNDLECYESKLRETFADFSIPFFYDAKRSMSAHPLVQLIRSVLSIIHDDWSYGSVFNYLKTNLSPLDVEDVDILENYALAYGVKGRRWRQEEWTYGDSFNLDDINYYKDCVTQSLEEVNIKRGKKYSIKYITAQLFNLLQSLNVAEKLEMFQTDEYFSEINGRIWQTTMDIFEKMVEILGDEQVDAKQYLDIFEAGVLENSIAFIPASLDQVVIGNMERSKLPNIKVLLVIGMNDGIVPAKPDYSGLITDTEKIILESGGVEISFNSKRQAFYEQFLLYSCFTKPQQKLIFTYSVSDVTGKKLRPSPLILKFKGMFDIIEDEMPTIAKKVPLKKELYTKLRGVTEGAALDNYWSSVYSTLIDEKTAHSINRILNEPSSYIKSISVKKIYGTQIMASASRLEKFKACPFAYFMQYGLGAEERKIYKLQTPDLGILFHQVLDCFAKRLEKESKQWRELSRQETEGYIENIVDELSKDKDIFYSTAQNRYLIYRLKRVAKRAVWTLGKHIAAGEFEPLGYEVGFGKKENLPPIVIELKDGTRLILTGKIDRVDIMSKEGNTYIKIIDYKSGKKSFSLCDLYYGLQLQLILYLDSIIKLGGNIFDENLLPGGVFYFRIDDPAITENALTDDEVIERLLLKELKLNGLVLNNTEVVRAMDSEINGYSDIIPVYMKTDGTLGAVSSAADIESFENLRNYVVKTVKEIGDEIIAGNIEIAPYKQKNTTACDFCLYSSVCKFEPRYDSEKYRVLTQLKSGEVLDKIKQPIK